MVGTKTTANDGQRQLDDISSSLFGLLCIISRSQNSTIWDPFCNFFLAASLFDNSKEGVWSKVAGCTKEPCSLYYYLSWIIIPRAHVLTAVRFPGSPLLPTARAQISLSGHHAHVHRPGRYRCNRRQHPQTPHQRPLHPHHKRLCPLKSQAPQANPLGCRSSQCEDLHREPFRHQPHRLLPRKCRRCLLHRCEQ